MGGSARPEQIISQLWNALTGTSPFQVWSALNFPPFRGIDNTTPYNLIAPTRATIPLVNLCDMVELFDL